MNKRMLLVRRREPTVRGSSARRTRHAGVLIRYGECQRNHAASMGGHAVDGCREFTADGEEGTGGTTMVCAACGCHRNFHRRVVVQEYDNNAYCSERH